jgi:hypothetical protein
MKKILYFLLVMPLIIFTSCDDPDCDDDSKNKVLMLKVDYQTYEFEGGIEYTFDQKTDSFTIDVNYIYYTDPETITLTYRELNQTLFSGTLIWNGVGEMTTPQSLHSPDYFESVSSDDVIFPSRGFTPMYAFLYEWDVEFYNVWMSIQHLEKVRKYLRSNPFQRIKVFVYTPRSGYADSNTDYYIFIQN